MQLILVLVFLYAFYKIIEPALSAETLVFSHDFNYYLLLCLSLFTLTLINAVLRKRRSELYAMQKNAARHIKATAKKKLSAQKENPFGLTMLMIEFAYVIGIAVAIYYYLDPERSLNWWVHIKGLNLQPPVTTIANFLIFALITGIFLWLHAYANQFNAMRFKGRSALRRKR
ncbi:hypothetical protein J7L85_02560 [candidate division WOR-3 bacterium]|nr:hypothetical protein [candidate division WOR-3 bacterium]